MSKKLLSILSAVVILAALISNVVWIALDQSPPLWDMAGHSEKSVEVAQLLAAGKLGTILKMPTIYPPLTYLVTAVFYLIGGQHADLPQYSLLIWLAIFAVALYDIVKRLYGNQKITLLSLALALAYPLLAHFSRIYDLDFPLTAMVTASLALLLRSENFSHRGYTVAFGLTVALTLLTKWTGIIFLAAPMLYILIITLRKREGRSRALLGFVLAIVLILVVAGPWYLYHGQQIIDSSVATRNNVFSVPSENLLSATSLTFYAAQTVRAITWPLAILFAAGVLLAIFRRKRGDVFLLLWLVVPYVVMTSALYSKESRYFLPAFPAIAALSAAAFLSARTKLKLIASAAVLIVAFIFWCQTSWGWPIISEHALAVLRLEQAYGLQEITPEKPYFGFTYPTQYQANVPEIVNQLKNDLEKNAVPGQTVTVAVVPNSIFLSGPPAKFYARLAGLVSINGKNRVDFSLSSKVRGSDWREQMVKADYLITKTGDQGPTVWGAALNEVRDAEAASDPIFADNFELIGTWPLRGIEGEEQEGRLYRKK